MTATLWRFSPLLFLVLIWEAVTRLGLVSQFALPPFSDVTVAFARMVFDDLWFHTARSLYRGGVGFGLAVAEHPQHRELFAALGPEQRQEEALGM